jgi:D-beta-D-heptose 7-phosphate kinase / D-beta-D-heptose 1-phosphate adenosyltransferase
MNEELLQIVSTLRSPRILVVGDYMLDVYIYGDALRISPEAPVPVLKVRNTEYSCGGASSVVANIAALRAEAVCLGLIGNDANGQRLSALLEKAGADTSGLLVTPDRPTITKKRLIGLAQHRHQQQLFRLDEESSDPLPQDISQALLERYQSLLSDVDIVCLQDYNKGLFSRDICQAMISRARHEGKQVLVDPAFIEDYSKYAGASLITPNRQETSLAVGYDLPAQDAFSQAATELQQSLNLEAVVITLDREGAYLLSAERKVLVPTRARKVYDVTGAGDMVLAALALALASDCDYETAVHLANLAGGLEVEKFGVATVTREEIICEIRRQMRDEKGKIRTEDELLAELTWQRKQGHSIVFTNGCFDVIHRGHIEYLQFCKTQGDIVVLGLNSDASVKMIKGPERPINNQDDRAAVLSALDCVDYITVFTKPDPLTLIQAVRPDVLIKGEDWKDKGVVGADFVEEQGGKVVLARLVQGKSSTSTIQKMKSIANEPTRNN